MQHKRGGGVSGAPAGPFGSPASSSMGGGGGDGASGASSGSGSGGKVYDVYSREIDPKNNMAADPTPGQLPIAGQQVPLSTGRVQSTIPKGGTESTWLYPSPQMFLNALSRKKKAGDVTEADAESMVAIHNNMNERTWAEVLRWEALHKDTCPDPKLLRFKGRPDELSPLAQMKTWTGCVLHGVLCGFAVGGPPFPPRPPSPPCARVIAAFPCLLFAYLLTVPCPSSLTGCPSSHMR